MQRNDHYQGHLPGSGVQKHSAGDFYPYTIAVIDRPSGGGHVRVYEVTGPGIHTPWEFFTAESAERAATLRKHALDAHGEVALKRKGTLAEYVDRIQSQPRKTAPQVYRETIELPDSDGGEI